MSFFRPNLSPINERRWSNFKKNRRGYFSLKFFLILFALTMVSELIVNDKPILVSYQGELLFPAIN